MGKGEQAGEKSMRGTESVILGKEQGEQVIAPTEGRQPVTELHVFDYCGHWIMIEKRNAFNHLLDEFFAGRLD